MKIALYCHIHLIGITADARAAVVLMIHNQSHSSTALAQLGPGGLGDWAGGAEINKEVIRVSLK